MKKKQASILHLADLLALHLQGEASEAQQAFVERWLSESEDHRQLYKQLELELAQPEAILQLRGLRDEATLKRILARRRKPESNVRRIAAWSAAAVLLVLIGLGSTYYLSSRVSSSVSKQKMVQITDIEGGQEHAILVMADQRQLDLYPGMDSSFQQPGVMVKLTGDSLHYMASSAPSEEELQILQTPNGSTFKMVLADGTKVWLNAGSSIAYPTRFKTKERKVEIKGEVYFQVAADAAHPFVVVSGSTQIKALGTSFNVRSYTAANHQTTLFSGLVQVSSGKKMVQLMPGEQAIETSDALMTKGANLRQTGAWREGLFIFEGTSVKEVLEEIERWYNVKIICQKGFTGKDLYHGELSRKLPLSKILKMLETTGVARFSLQGRTIYAASPDQPI